jgi:enoyl-CoA hydratase/carnithine racemase
VHRIEAALDAWAADDAVALLVIDAAGEKAFCAGGDIAEMYAAGTMRAISIMAAASGPTSTG